MLDNHIKCRLCKGSSKFKFNLTVLNKYVCKYYLCMQCDSLQTEMPFWIDEAYADKSLSILDTGAFQRNIKNLSVVYLFSKIFNAKNILDVGGGDGLLCRMLRDYGLNCYVNDKYADNLYAQGFSQPNFHKPNLIIGFEVVEHFPDPSIDMENLFMFNSELILISTTIYKLQKKDWWYLSPQSGQHIFFYSEKAIKFIAKKYDYSYILLGGYIFFYKKKSYKIILLKIFFRNKLLNLILVLLFMRSPLGVQEDYVLALKKITKSRDS